MIKTKFMIIITIMWNNEKAREYLKQCCINNEKSGGAIHYLIWIMIWAILWSINCFNKIVTELPKTKRGGERGKTIIINAADFADINSGNAL